MFDTVLIEEDVSEIKTALGHIAAKGYVFSDNLIMRKVFKLSEVEAHNQLFEMIDKLNTQSD